MNNTHPDCSARRPSLRSQSAEQLLLLGQWGSGLTVLCAQARGGPDQASTRHEELLSEKDLCHIVSWPGGGTTWGGEWGGLREGWISDMGLKKQGAGGRSMFSALRARCSGLWSQRCPGRQRASGQRICQTGMTHRLKSSPLSQSLEGSSIWWFLQGQKKPQKL